MNVDLFERIHWGFAVGYVVLGLVLWGLFDASAFTGALCGACFCVVSVRLYKLVLRGLFSPGSGSVLVALIAIVLKLIVLVIFVIAVASQDLLFVICARGGMLTIIPAGLVAASRER